MRPTILLTGRTGQVGSQLHRLLPKLGRVIAPDRNELDLADQKSIRRVIGETNPQFIVNAAAYTAVDAAETDQARAFAINAVAPEIMALEAKRLGASLIHYSTDYVFDGRKRAPYTESDSTNPINVYGKTKLAGEEAITSSGAPHLIFRTSWVYSTTGRNFLLTILRLATERRELRVVQDQVGAPTCARDIAAATTRILEDLCAETSYALSSEISGVYHMTATEETSWCDFARAILGAASSAVDLPWFESATQGRPLIAEHVVPISTEEFRSPTPRPRYSVLSNSRFLRTFNFTLRDWRTQLVSCFALENCTREE
jgi:dTDP-4-dehydrorhamnose reductase